MKDKQVFGVALVLWITILLLFTYIVESQTQQISKLFYINSQVSNNLLECGNTTNPCSNIQHALDYFASNNSEMINNISNDSNSTLTLGIQLTFIILNNENNFCGYKLNTTYNQNIYYELNFIGNEFLTLTCTINYGELNFIEERQDIEKLSFRELFLDGIVFKSCSTISLVISNCKINRGGFMTVYKPMICPIINSTAKTVRYLQISNMETWYSLIFIGNVKSAIVENSIMNEITGFSFKNIETLQVLNFKVIGQGTFFTKDVDSIYVNNFISTSATFNMHVKDFKSFIMEKSSYQNYQYFDSAISLDRGDFARISDTSVQRSSQWLAARTLKKIIISNIRFIDNYVIDARNLSPIYITSCDDILIENSYFDGNSGFKSGAIHIDDYFDVEVSNNTFKNGRSPLNGGALILANYQSESVLENASVLISNNSFINNICSLHGGAVFINSLSKGIIKGNKFIRNQAYGIGGALIIVEHCRDCLIESYFEENWAYGLISSLDNSETIFSTLMADRIVGTAGAFAVFTEPRFPLRIDGSVFVRNIASKGGAMLIGFNLPFIIEQSPRTVVNNCKFEGNEARKTGDDIYTVNLQSPVSLLRTFINQTEENENSFSSTPSVFRIEKMSTNKVYPGQSIDIKFYVENTFGREIDIQSQFVAVDKDSAILPFLNYSNHDSKSLKFTPYSLFAYLPPISLFNFTIYSEDRRLSVKVPFELLSCPPKFLPQQTIVYSKIVYHCVSDNSLDLALVLGITIPLGILFLTVGAILGGLSVYVIRFTIRQISLLKTKQRAEKSLEKRIIDKKIIFNTNSDLSDTYYSKYSTKISDLAVPLIESGMEKPITPSFVIPIESIDIIKKLAEGGLGIIFLGKLWKKIDVAIKLLKSNEQDEEFEQEVSLLSSLRHDNIVTFYGICVSDDAKYMITEFVEKGSLDKALYKSRIGEIVMSLEKKMSILIATARGIEYLHGLTPTVVHRDLKPGNILLEDKNQAKICDFGISRTVSNATVQQTAMTTNLGTLIYCPNEVIEGPTSTNKASKQTATKIDIFSFAVIMWEVFFEIIPYSPSIGKLTPLFQLSKEESEMLTLNSFNIPYFVVKGIRPMIPFRTDEQIRKWVEQYMPVLVNNSNMVQFVKRYFALVQLGWSVDASKRPDITTVLQELEELKNLIR